MTLHAALNRSRRPRGGGPLAALLGVLALVVALLALAVPAQAADPSSPEEIGRGLRAQPVYVDEGARDRLSAPAEKALVETIESTGEPVFIVVLPEDSEYNEKTILSDIREATGRAGVYGVLLGDDFGAASDSTVLPGNTAQALADRTEAGAGGDVDAAALTTFAGQAATAVDNGPAQAPGDGEGVPVRGPGIGGLIFGVLVLGGLFAVTLTAARSAVRVRKESAADLARVKATVDEDVTSYGEELDRLDFDPSAPGGSSEEENEALVTEYSAALDAYEEAKYAMARVRSAEDVEEVTSALEAGRFALATLRARRAGEPLPEHRSPCFFDPRHGPSVTDRPWRPEGGEVRSVPVCAADATRIDDGESPMAREVETAYGRRPYWEAGPAYAPWIGGFFGAYGASMMSGMLIGTMLGSSMGAGSAWAGDGGMGGDGFGGGFDGGFGGFGGGF